MVTDQKQEIQVLREYVLDARPAKHGLELAAIFASDAHLKAAFSRIRVASSCRPSAIIPHRLYIEAEKQTYLSPLCELAEDDLVLHDEATRLAVHLIYPMSASMRRLLQQHFPAFRLRHLNTCLLAALQGHLAAQSGYHVFVHVSGAQLLVMAFDRQELLLVNTFPYKSAKDFLYYVLLAYQQLGLPKADTPLFLSGQLVKDAEIYRLLYRYIDAVDFLSPPAVLKPGNKLGQFPPYFYFDLYSLALAEALPELPNGDLLGE